MLHTMQRHGALLLLLSLAGLTPGVARAQTQAATADTAVELEAPAPEAPAEAPAPEFTAAARKKAAELLARAVEAIGGAERLAAVKNVETAMTVALTTARGTAKLPRKTALIFPDRLRQETDMPMGTMAQVVDGDTGFLLVRSQVLPLSGPQLAEAQARLRRDLLALLRRRGSEGFTAGHTGAGEVEGTAVETVEVRLDGDTVHLGIDPESGRVRSMGYHGKWMRREGEIHKVLSDYRKVGGLTLPFATAGTLDGEPLFEAAIESIGLDGEIDPALFDRPNPDRSRGPAPDKPRRAAPKENQ